MNRRDNQSSGRGSRPMFGPGRGRGPMGHRGPMAMMKGDTATDFRGTMAKLIKFLGRYKWPIMIVLVFAIASTAANIAGPKILGEATTELFEGVLAQLRGTGQIDFDAIARILIITMSLYLLSALFGYIQGWIMADVSTDIAYQFRRDISQKISRLPLKYFDGTTQGEVLTFVTNDVDTINQTLSQSLTQIITSVITVIGVLVMMLTINWVMTLVTLMILPLSMGVVALIVSQSQKHFKRQQDYLGHVNGHIEEMFGGHIIVKAFNGEEKSIQTFDGFNDTLFDSAWRSQFLSGLMMPISMFIGNLGYVAVVVMGGWLTIRGSISVGDIQAFIQYVRSFTQPVRQLANVSNVLQQTAAAAERVFAFLEQEEEVKEVVDPIELKNIEGRVEFKNVQFGYDQNKIVIHDFSAIAQPGKKVAIVGPTGAGKTTMVKLLMRFYDVNGGSIMVDGHDIREFTRNDLRRMFGMVLQDTWLFNGSIMENIRYCCQDAPEDKVVAAARTAHVDHFVRTLPEGYNMELNEEATNISQGQKQLLTIARAVLVDPPMLILDEATSSVDTRTEVLIQEAMDRLMVGRTSFIIAHRLSTIRNADLILVMNDGDIVESGNHEELLERDGFYAELYNSQFEIVQANAAD